MNYFEWFGLNISFYPDEQALREAYYRISQKYHPDFFAQAEAEEQKQALEQSTYTNQAFKTLSHPDSRIAYVLELKGLIREGEKPKLDPEFLMEMMDLNESLSEALLSQDQEKIRSLEATIEGLENELKSEMRRLCLAYDEGNSPEAGSRITQLSYQKKYLRRLRDQLENEAPEM